MTKVFLLFWRNLLISHKINRLISDNSVYIFKYKVDTQQIIAVSPN